MFNMTPIILRNNTYGFKGLIPNIGLFPAFTRGDTVLARPLEPIPILTAALYVDALFHMFC